MTQVKMIPPKCQSGSLAMRWPPPHLPASMRQTEIDVSVNDKEEPIMKIKRVSDDLAGQVVRQGDRSFIVHTTKDPFACLCFVSSLIAFNYFGNIAGVVNT